MIENFEFKKNKDEIREEAIFQEFFPTGKIEKVSAEEIIPDAMEFFEINSTKYIYEEDYKPGNFEEFYIIKHDNGDLTYVAEQQKKYPDDGDEVDDYEKDTYFFETKGGNKIGHGELRYNISSKDEFFIGKPFVGFTDTEKDYRRTGLGKRRIIEMNAYSQMRYKLSLHSSTTITPEAKKLWE